MSNTFKSFFVNSYPRSGNTWIRLALIEAMNAQAIDLNPVFFTKYRFINLHRYNQLNISHENGWIFKSHLKWNEIPQNLSSFKGLYIVRDGRDSLLSYYFYNKKHKKYTESWDHFFDRYFYKKKHSSYREKVLLKEMGDWAGNVTSYLQREQVFILKYENLICNTLPMIKDLFIFLEIDFQNFCISIETAFKKSADALAIKKDRDNAERKRGGNGGWRDFYTNEQNEIFINRSGEMLKHFGYHLT